MKVRRMLGEILPVGRRAPGVPHFLDGLPAVAVGDGRLDVRFRPPLDLALPELLAVPGFTGTWDVEAGVLVAGRVPYLVDRPPTASVCLVMAAKLAGLGLDETARLLGLRDRILDGVALDLRDWVAPHPESIAAECGLLEAWRHCVAQFTSASNAA